MGIQMNHNDMSDKGKKSSGCLSSVLKVSAFVILLPFILALGWLYGIIWLLFFRKRIADRPDAKRKTLFTGAITAVSLLFLIYAYNNPSTTEDRNDSSEEYFAAMNESTVGLQDESLQSIETETQVVDETESSTADTMDYTESIADSSNHGETLPEGETKEIIPSTDVISEEASTTVPSAEDSSTKEETSYAETSVTEPSMENSSSQAASNDEPSPSSEAASVSPAPQEPVSQSVTYILNTNTKKIHLPNCSSVKQMAEKNKATSNESIATLEAKGYSKCKNCLDKR